MVNFDNINVIMGVSAVGEWKIEFYQISEDNSPVLDWFKGQEPKVKAKIGRIFDLLEEQGIARKKILKLVYKIGIN